MHRWKVSGQALGHGHDVDFACCTDCKGLRDLSGWSLCQASGASLSARHLGQSLCWDLGHCAR